MDRHHPASSRFARKRAEALLEGHIEAFTALGGVPSRHIRYDNLTSQSRRSSTLRTIGQDFAVEQPLLAPLPTESFDPGLVLTARVDRSSLVTVRSTKYSVPVRFISRKVRVSLQATQVRIFDGRTFIATPPRTVARGGQCVQLDHYLEVLKFKPGALPGATAWRKTDGDAEPNSSSKSSKPAPTSTGSPTPSNKPRRPQNALALAGAA